jgi:hypothetical protein
MPQAFAFQQNLHILSTISLRVKHMMPKTIIGKTKLTNFDAIVTTL